MSAVRDLERCLKRQATKTTRNMAAKLEMFNFIGIILILKLTLTAQCAQTSDAFYYQDATAAAAAAELSNFTTNSIELPNNATPTIPTDVYRELKKMSDMRNLIQEIEEKFIGNEESKQPSVERANALWPKPATCIPTDTIVSLQPFDRSLEPDELIYPQCTRVKRCSGCCSARLGCQPTRTERVNFNVSRFSLYPSLRRIGNEIIPIEVHKSCACACLTKASDCNGYQNYERNNCACTCRNAEARAKCLLQDGKDWKEETCRCECSMKLTCTTGTIFDKNSCECVPEE